MDRRTFLLLTGFGALAGSLPIFLKTHLEQADAETAIAQTATFQAVGNLNQLRSPQDQVRGSISGIPVVVIRRPGNPTELLAFNRRCPHEGCRVDWQGEANQFICPCHNAEFSTSGSVTRGPARSPLQRLPVRVEGNQILVQVPSRQASLEPNQDIA